MQHLCKSFFKMLYLIGPDGLVNLNFENFQKMVWMTIVHVLRFRIKHIILSHDVFWKFAYLQKTRYADFAGLPTNTILTSHKPI